MQDLRFLQWRWWEFGIFWSRKFRFFKRSYASIFMVQQFKKVHAIRFFETWELLA